MIKLLQKKTVPTISIPIHNVIVVKSATCEGGHKCRINPAFVLIKTPCSTNTYCTNEPDFLFYAEGNTYDEITTSLGNKLCHYWQIYGNIEEDFIDENPDIRDMQNDFRGRITFENDVLEIEE